MADENKDGVPDEIAAEPGALGQFTLRGPGVKLYQFDGTAKLAAGMPEGRTYATKDETASKNLANFVQATALGFNAYASSAHRIKDDYLASDEAAAGGLRSIASITHQAV
jgi:hypothetical protein